MLDFADKLILVTGAARGIGRGVAFEYASRGARLVILDILETEVQATAKDMRAAGYTVSAFRCDLGNNDEVASLGAKITAELGTPDILHNNAFYSRPCSVEDMDMPDILKALDVSVLGYLRIVQCFVKQMIERRSGWIVNTASPNGIAPPIEFAECGLAYNMCKAADISMSQSMAAALRRYNIGISVIFPGAVATAAADQKPSGNHKPEHVAAVKRYFSDRAVTPDVAAKDFVEGVRQEKFLITTFPNFEKVLVEFAQNGMDPHGNYSWD